MSDGEKALSFPSHYYGGSGQNSRLYCIYAGRELLFFKPKDAACEHFRIVTGPVYKCKLIPREAVVYMEEGTYSSTAMVIRINVFW